MPNGWTTVTVGELEARGEAELKTGPFGTQLHASDYVESGVPMINAGNVGFREVREEKLDYLSEETVRRLSSHLLDTGDIVFGRKGTAERHAFIREKHKGWFQGTDCLRLRLRSPQTDNSFVSYSFMTHEHKHWIIGQASHGATMTSLNQDIIRRITLHLPPMPVQRKIAGVLAAYDELIENNTRRIKLLEQMAQALYREWFVRPCHSGNLPKGWETKRVADVATLLRGKSYRSEDLAEEGGLPFLNLKCMDRDGGFRLHGIKRFCGEFKDHHTAKAGDIVIAVTDMTQERRIVARAARVPRTAEPLYVMSMDLVRLAPKPGIPDAYLYAMLRYSEFPDEVKQHANGVNVLHLSPDRIAQFEFPLPDKARREQFSEAAQSIFEQCDVLNLKNANLRRTRDLLLPKLISGELDVSKLDIGIGEEAA